MKKLISLLLVLIMVVSTTVIVSAQTEVKFVYKMHGNDFVKEEIVEVDNLDRMYLTEVAKEYVPKGHYIINNSITRVSDTEYIVPIAENDLVHTGIEDIEGTMRINLVYKYGKCILKIKPVTIPDLRQVSWMLAYDYIDKLTEKNKPFYMHKVTGFEQGKRNCLIVWVDRDKTTV